MAGELRCKAIRYKTALPLIQGGSATAGPMCAERCPRDYVCEPAVPNFKAHPVVGHKENGESIFRYIYTDIQKELTVKLRQSIEVYQSVELTEESRMALGQWLEQWLKNIRLSVFYSLEASHLVFHPRKLRFLLSFEFSLTQLPQKQRNILDLLLKSISEFLHLHGHLHDHLIILRLPLLFYPSLILRM